MEIYNYTKTGVKKQKEIKPKTPTWVDVIDPDDEDLKYISDKLDIPLFALKRCRENIRPKLEIFNGFIFLNFKIVKRDEDITSEQISFFFSEKYLITIHSKCPNCGASKKEIKEIMEYGEKVDHKELLKRLKREGLPTQLEF